VLNFPGGEALKMTIAEWMTPLKRKIDGIGVKPDIVVDGDDRDAPLRRALDILR
jgi:C-terminal processing protease CtpA/Prc